MTRLRDFKREWDGNKMASNRTPWRCDGIVMVDTRAVRDDRLRALLEIRKDSGSIYTAAALHVSLRGLKRDAVPATQYGFDADGRPLYVGELAGWAFNPTRHDILTTRVVHTSRLMNYHRGALYLLAHDKTPVAVLMGISLPPHPWQKFPC